ncbi:hypothetical protein BDV96DRAFT_595901 [Lophiotrema nucula]|uniref:F-box domain-containing protein n=1 Tax=Lophiotrema nucula TaxID=690887 RepID=A0A6A5ZNB9_9PLEO|nr:hypothetical protein BDV96DRAFT_595901 [Lophiotrema nucula]
MARITDLPNELLTTIFQLARDTNPAALRALPLLCKALHQAGNAVLHEHIALYWKLNSHSSLNKFIKQDPNTDLVRSLRLHVQKGPLNAFTIGMPIATLHVSAICTMLTTLPKLATFSICLDGQIDHRCTLPGNLLCKFLNALPESVKNLELDTQGADGKWNTPPSCLLPDDHICSSISRLLPQLQTLRLRAATLCPELLLSLQASSQGVQPTTKVRMATINLELGDVRHPGPGQSWACGGTPKSAPGGYNTIDVNKFFGTFLDLQKGGAFPHLQHWYILTQQEHPMIRVRDVATRSVTDYPVQFANSVSSTPRINRDDDNDDDLAADDGQIEIASREQQVNPFAIQQWYIIRDQDGTDWYGSIDEIKAAVDFEGRWEETEDGWRLPKRIARHTSEGLVTHRLRTDKLKSLDWMLEQADAVRRESDRLAQVGRELDIAETVRQVSVPVDRFNGEGEAGVWFVD